MENFKCNYCEARTGEVEQIPREWLIFRMKLRESDNIYIKGPIACPFHKYQIYLATFVGSAEEILEKDEYFIKLNEM